MGQIPVCTSPYMSETVILATFLDRKGQRPDKMGRKKALGLGYYTQEMIFIL